MPIPRHLSATLTTSTEDGGSITMRVELYNHRFGQSKPGMCLSVTGEERDRKGQVSAVGCLHDMLAKYFPEWAALIPYHLNDMRAGCEHQRSAKWEDMPMEEGKGLDARIKDPQMGYSVSNRKVHVWARDGGLLEAPCPECGYKYGTKWLFEPLPEDILKLAERFCNGE